MALLDLLALYMLPVPMAKSKSKAVYVCQNCGAQRSRWEGRCNDCGQWNTFVEEVFDPSPRAINPTSKLEVSTILEVPEEQLQRTKTGLQELDRVLGGGLTHGCFVLLGGEPGVGKSTLLLQMASGLSQSQCRVLYLSAEESVSQTSARARRMKVHHENIQLAAENNLETIIEKTKELKPQILIIDSIQTVYHPTVTSAPGSVSQVRECAGHLMTLAKTTGISVILVGHVTKDGSIAGPKVLEHLVDTVLSFEGDHSQQFRILRVNKNRFGATHEVGVFQMGSEGLKEISNPSEFFLEERSEGSVGSVVFASMEGTRPILCEVQALTVSSTLPTPRRNSLGFDLNRVHLLIAVLEKHASVHLSQQEVFVNVVGGLKIQEPAADLAVAAALCSSVYNKPSPARTSFMGEIGLTGEIRAIPFLELRIKEAYKMGFEKFYAPHSNKKNIFDLPTELEKRIVWMKNLPKGNWF